MRIVDVFEAPVSDYQLIGKWGDDERGHSFSDPRDRKLLQNPKAIQKIKQSFTNIEHDINLYFVNLPGYRKFTETGMHTVDEIAEKMPEVYEYLSKDGKHLKDEVNVLFLSNVGFKKRPMTPWIIAHRIGHAINATRRNLNDYSAYFYWREAENLIFDFFKRFLEDVYKTSKIDNIGIRYIKFVPFLEQIGTFKSARDKNLNNRPYEFMYECFAQYLVTGKIIFREPGAFKFRKQRYQPQDKEMYEYYVNSLQDYAREMEQYFDTALAYTKGYFLVM